MKDTYIIELGKNKASKEGDSLQRSFAVPKIQWASYSHCPENLNEIVLFIPKFGISAEKKGTDSYYESVTLNLSRVGKALRILDEKSRVKFSVKVE